MMDNWGCWYHAIGACSIITLFRARAVNRAFKARCDEVLATIWLPGPTKEDPETGEAAETGESMLDAINARRDISRYARCGDVDVARCVMKQSLMFYDIGFSFGLSHSEECIKMIKENSILAHHPALCGILSRNGPLLMRDLSVLPCAHNTVESTFGRATSAWQLKLYDAEVEKGQTHASTIYWKYDLIVREWTLLRSMFQYTLFSSQIGHIVEVLLTRDDIDHFCEIIGLTCGQMLNMNTIHVTGGKKWPMAMASRPGNFISNGIVLTMILNKHKIDEDLPAIELCMTNGACLCGLDVIKHPSPNLFKLWVGQNPGIMPIEDVEPYIDNFEGWGLLMLAEYQPQHAKQVLRHAANRGMFDEVRTLVEDMGVTLDERQLGLLNPPNQIVSAYLTSKFQKPKEVLD